MHSSFLCILPLPKLKPSAAGSILRGGARKRTRNAHPRRAFQVEADFAPTRVGRAEQAYIRLRLACFRAEARAHFRMRGTTIDKKENA